MKIILAGGTGQVGSLLARAFRQTGDDVVVLSRQSYDPSEAFVPWDAKNPGPWTDALEGADVVINLAGRSVNCRYGAENRRLIMDSRIDSTLAIGRAIASALTPPRLWLQASTATIYAHRFDAPNTESTGILGGEEENAPETWRFSIEVAKAWEAAAASFDLPRTRQILLRSAIIMSPDPGGPFALLRKLALCGLGGTMGDGRQFVSWIHAHDFVAAIRWIIAHQELTGPVNLSSPRPLANAAFMRELRQAARAPFGLPATAEMLEIGAFFMRTETELLLKSRFVTPERLEKSGFHFAFPAWSEAAADLCRR